MGPLSLQPSEIAKLVVIFYLAWFLETRREPHGVGINNVTRTLLPAIVAALLDRNDQRHADRAQAWARHSAQTLAREAAYQRITATRQQIAHRQRSRDQGYGLEL